MELEVLIEQTAILEAELVNFAELEIHIISDSELEALLN